MDQLRVLDEVRTWASADPNIRLVVLTGSVARGNDAADELSDLDLELYVLDAHPLLDRRDWYQRFGEVLVVEELDNPDWHPTRLIYYVDGKIDFMIASVESASQGLGYSRPYRVLMDKDGLGEHLHPAPDPGERPPQPAEFDTCVNWFYAAALMWARCIVRDEPWMAKVREWDANTQLLQMIEWDHKSRYGWNFDTRHLGLHMRDWMDEDIIAGVQQCWAEFSTQSLRSALSASITLFETLSKRVAGALGLGAFDDDPVRREIARLLSLAREPG